MRERIFTNYRGVALAIWKFGPGTRNPWPTGDFYEDGSYYSKAYFTVDAPIPFAHGLIEIDMMPNYLKVDDDL